MKAIKIISLILLVIMILISAFSIVSSAESVTELSDGEYTFTVANGEATLTGCIDKTQIYTIYIPSYLNDGTKSYPVTAIGKHAFADNRKVKTVSLHDDSKLKRIELNAFACCTSLESINLPYGIEEIGDGAFQNCYSLCFEFHNSIKRIGKMAFMYCYSLVDIRIPVECEKIEESAFLGCNALESVQFSVYSKLKCIEKYAFKGCTSLGEVLLPETVVSIGEKAFSNCGNIIGMYLSDKITEIGAMAFDDCVKLYVEKGSAAESYAVQSGIRHFIMEEPEILLVGETKLIIDAREGFLYSINNSGYNSSSTLTKEGGGNRRYLYTKPKYIKGGRGLMTMVVFDGQDEIPKEVNAEYLVLLKNELMTGGKNMAGDFNRDNILNIFDLIKAKKSMAA